MCLVKFSPWWSQTLKDLSLLAALWTTFWRLWSEAADCKFHLLWSCNLWGKRTFFPWSPLELRATHQCVLLYLRSFTSLSRPVYLFSYLIRFSFFYAFRYFPASSTKEMLDEWRPLLCVFDGVMQKAISNMELFLPTILPPEEHIQGFQWVGQPGWQKAMMLLPASMHVC